MVGKHFTRDEIEELRKSLATSSMKDSDLDDSRELLLKDYVAVVQDGKNRKASIEVLGDLLTDRRHIVLKSSDSSGIQLPEYSCDVLVIYSGTDDSALSLELPAVSEDLHLVVRVASLSGCEFKFSGGNVFDTRKSEKSQSFSLMTKDASIVWLDFVASDNLWYAAY